MKSPKEYAIVDIIMKQQHTHESMLASHCFNLQWWNVFRKKKVVTKQNINIDNCHKKYCRWESITYKWRAKYNVKKTNPDVSQIKLH